MITIPAVPNADGVLHPATPIPADRLATVCDGANYTVYEPGDPLPPPPESGS